LIERITRIGNSRGIIFDSALMELAQLKPRDDLTVEVHDEEAVVNGDARDMAALNTLALCF
jgi:antitoxin component of MazEF toxin-antitoxin module